MPTTPTPVRWICRDNWTWSDNRWGGYRVWVVRPGTVLLVTPASPTRCWVKHPDGTTLTCSRVSLSRHCTKEEH